MFNNLTIAGKYGATLIDNTNAPGGANKTVNGTLNLSNTTTTGSPAVNNGYVTTGSTNLLVLAAGASTSIANSVSGVPQYNSPYVYGPIEKIGNTPFIFPVGKQNGCVPIGITAPTAATDAFTAQYMRSSAKALGGISSTNGLGDVSICDYWVLDHTVVSSGFTNVAVSGYWNANSPCNGETSNGGYNSYVNNLTTIALAHFNTSTSKWDNNSISANSFTTGTDATGSVTWSGVSTFSPFALGNNTSANSNPLAIKLDYFTAAKANGYNKLIWKAECTDASASFVLERSSDGIGFTGIDSVTINSATDCAAPFSYNDYTSSGPRVYYRVKMVDITGNVSYSEIRLILNGASTFELLSIKPNPVQSEAWLNVSASQSSNVELVIYSVDGREIQRRTVQVAAGSSTINLQTSNLAKGVYVIRGLFSSGQTNTIPFVKQ